MAGGEQLLVDGIAVPVTNRGKVLFGDAVTTKEQVIAYYVAAAPAMLPHLAGRPVTRKRWPNGTGDGLEWFAKALDTGTPPWLPRVQVAHGSRTVFYPLLDSSAGLAWMGQSAALELHVPQWRLTDPGSRPGRADRVVLDLDPGEGAGLTECVQVAFAIRDRLGPLGAQVVPVTSGSKGLHLYVPLPEPIDSADATLWARQVANEMVKALPRLVVSTMSKARREGKVLLDWSQNNAKKTTIAPYSLRGRTHPTVAAPRTWDELTGSDLAHLTYRQVLDRLAAGHDPLATLTRTADTHRPSRRPVTVPAPPRRVIRTPPSDPPAAVTAPNPRAAAAPSGLRPMLASPGALADVSGPEWCIEGKWDGMRALVQVDAGGVVLRSRPGRDVTATFPELAELAALLAGHHGVFDGEIVALDGAGRTDFSLLQQRMGVTRPATIAALTRQVPAFLLLFDVLHLDGVDLTGARYDRRRQILEALHVAGRHVAVPEQLTGAHPAAILERTRRDGWEGIVAKRVDSTYQPGERTTAWRKVKNHIEVDVTVIGWLPGRGRRGDSIGALVVATTDDHGDLRYAGRVGTGFTDATLDRLHAVLLPLEVTNPAVEVPAADQHARWVHPEVTGQVAATERLRSGVLRHPSWRGQQPPTTGYDHAPVTTPWRPSLPRVQSSAAGSV